jgi:enoyl-CoA hydratase/carnithine racemase
MTAAEVLVERRGAALWIIINREARRNAMNAAVLIAMQGAIQGAVKDPQVRAIVLTGAGDKAFCAGADLGDGTGVFTRGLDDPMTDFGRLARTVRDIGVPLIARVNGACVAGAHGNV